MVERRLAEELIASGAEVLVACRKGPVQVSLGGEEVVWCREEGGLVMEDCLEIEKSSYLMMNFPVKVVVVPSLFFLPAWVLYQVEVQAHWQCANGHS